MSHSNISIFVPHIGCPHKCAFCNQKTITGVQNAPHADDVKRICRQALKEVSSLNDTEIAFFGGSFTAIPRSYMTELLDAAGEFIGNDGFKGIRISTRPDCIDEEILSVLSSYGVTAIELGAQSMDDSVLKANERGHTAEDVVKASQMIKKAGFELGLQVMVGLYKSDFDTEMLTKKRVLEIKPDTVRIYPVCVLRGTRLSQLYESGEYKLYSFDKAVKICTQMAEAFSNAGIKILRIGLHSSDNVKEDMVAGFYHEAFGELVRTEYVRNILEKYAVVGREIIIVYAGKSMVSAVSGHKKSNKLYFYERGVKLEIKPCPCLKSHEIRIDKDVYQCI